MNSRFVKLISSTLILGLMLMVGSNLSAQVKSQADQVAPKAQVKPKIQVKDSKALFKAVASSPVKVVRPMLKEGDDVNIKNDEGLTLLMVTALSAKADPKTIDFLIFFHGADIHQTTKDGKTIFDLLASSTSPKAGLMKKKLLTGWLHQEAQSGTLESMQKAIKAGADINSVDLMEETPLMSATKSQISASEKIKMLLAAGASPNNSLDGKVATTTALSDAAYDMDIDKARLLLEAGANVNEAIGTGKYSTALGRAAINLLPLPNKQEQMVKLLVEYGAISLPHKLMHDPLTMALATGASPKVISTLLGIGSMVNGSVPLGIKKEPPLMLGMTVKADPENIKLLLVAGADWKVYTKEGETIFDRVDREVTDPGRKDVIRKIIMTEQFIDLCADGSVEEVKEAIAQGINLNRPNAFQTPLMATTTDAKFGVAKAKLLLAAGAKVNGRNGDHMTPLQVAASRDNVPMVKFLLEKGAEVNAVDSYGRTALWETLHQGRKQCPGLPKNKTGNENCFKDLKLQKQVIELLKKAGAVSQPTPEALKAF